MAVSETTLLALRPSRVIALGSYIASGFSFLLAFLVSFVLFTRVPGVGPFTPTQVTTASAILFVFLGFVLILRGEWKRLSTRYTITDFRIVRKDGILRRSENVMPYNKVERVNLSQGIIERILGIGTVTIDTGEDQMLIASVRDPRNVERTIMGRLQRIR